MLCVYVCTYFVLSYILSYKNDIFYYEKSLEIFYKFLYALYNKH